MALRQIVVNSAGIELSYHRVISIMVDVLADEARASVAVYKDKEARDAGKQQAATIVVNLGKSKELIGDNSEPNMVKRSYELLKVRAEYAGCQDV